MNHPSGTIGGGVWPPFTVAQWQELEHQALIFKYLKAGLPVPPDLLCFIRRSFASTSAGLFHPNSGYGSLYGSKFDPEPGRCRRTDGKKWRCSKDAYPDSKYCERHINRTRTRSRKPVESIYTSQSSSAVASSIATGSRNGSRSLQNLPLNSSGNREGLCFGSNASKLQRDPIPYGISNKEYRCLQGLKDDSDEHDFVPKVSGSVRCPEINPMDSEWGLMKSLISSNHSLEPRNNSLLQNNYLQLQDFGSTTDAVMVKQQQHCFPGREFISPQSVNQEHQSLQPPFNEWPKSKDAGSYLDDKESNKNSFSVTQLSMSIPMTPSEFNTRSAPSPNGMFFSI